MTALAGANLIYGLGMLDIGLTLDYTKLVMDDEIAYMVRHIIKGIDVNESTLAVDVIKAVGPGGEFVSHPHTFQNFKETQSIAKLIDRRNPDEWKRMGSKSFFDNANAVACDLYDNYQATPLPESVKKEMRDIVNEAEEHYGVKLSEE